MKYLLVMIPSSPYPCKVVLDGKIEPRFHFFLPDRNRISLVGLSAEDVTYFAECIDKVAREEEAKNEEEEAAPSRPAPRP